jgi:hypothetical protein
MITQIKDAIQGKAPLSAKRSSKWPTVRARHIKANSTCAVCGGSDVLEVHHILPFHIDPSLELSPENLITLCESRKGGLVCHLAIGHLGSYKNQNPTVREDAAFWKQKLTQ